VLAIKKCKYLNRVRLLFLLIIYFFTYQGASATVWNIAQGDQCSLSSAIRAANTNQATLFCQAGESDTTDIINLTTDFTFTSRDISSLISALPSISSDIVINGNGHSLKRASNAEGDFRILTIDQGTVSLNDITISGGLITRANSGAGIVVNSSAVLNMNKVTVSGNRVIPLNENSGGSAGGILSSGQLTIRNSIITENSAFSGGGIFSSGESSSLTIIDSIISKNSANSGPAGISIQFGTASISNSTINDNSLVDGVGGSAISVVFTEDFDMENSLVYNNNTSAFGGGMQFINSGGDIINTTISGNTGREGAGIFLSRSSVNLINSNISFNSNTSTSEDNGSIHISVADEEDKLTLSNTIVSNTAGGNDCWIDSNPNANFSPLSADRFNIIEDGSCNTNARAVNPLIGALTDNGGPTLTHELLAGSPAINAGNQSICNTLQGTDQRGFPYVQLCDIGPFEFQTLLDISDDELCFPVSTPSKKVAVICL